jgi:hypothetical protein
MASRPVARIFLRVIENAEDLDGPIVAPSVDSGACRGCMGMEATGMVTLHVPARPASGAIALAIFAVSGAHWPPRTLAVQSGDEAAVRNGPNGRLLAPEPSAVAFGVYPAAGVLPPSTCNRRARSMLPPVRMTPALRLAIRSRSCNKAASGAAPAPSAI